MSEIQKTSLGRLSAFCDIDLNHFCFAYTLCGSQTVKLRQIAQYPFVQCLLAITLNYIIKRHEKIIKIFSEITQPLQTLSLWTFEVFLTY